MLKSLIRNLGGFKATNKSYGCSVAVVPISLEFILNAALMHPLTNTRSLLVFFLT